MSDQISRQTRQWVVVVFSVIVGFGGLVFGLVNGNAIERVDRVQQYAAENRVEIKCNTNEIVKTNRTLSVVVNEQEHFAEALDQINEKLDQILERGHN